ncbi:MAG: hypothetical protein H6617_05095 [Bdellovibrionaceae bacterium]|nr:hypothetical protein [Bdellovibrionales bacterium]MCB9254040.1 hypothetical protein [Pseudobdellovibrionaceae bacterium]
MTTEEFIEIGQAMLQNPSESEKPFVDLAEELIKEAGQIQKGERKKVSYALVFSVLYSVGPNYKDSAFWRAYEQWLRDNPHLESQRTDPVEIVASEEDNES